MLGEGQERWRSAARQTAKNTWQIDCTVETGSRQVRRSNNPDDLGDTVTEGHGLALLAQIKDIEAAFRKDGRRMVGDE